MSEKQSGYSSKGIEKRRIHVSSKRQIRPAVEALIKEAYELAKSAAEDQTDLTDEIFGITESEG